MTEQVRKGKNKIGNRETKTEKEKKSDLGEVQRTKN